MKYSDFELAYLVKEEEEIFNYLIKKYEPLFRKIAKSLVTKFPYKGLDMDDLVQQGRIATCYALDRFDQRNDILLYSYIYLCVKRAMFNYARSYINKPDCYTYMGVKEYENMNDFVDNVCIDNILIDREFMIKVIEFKHSLNYLDSWILELRLNGFMYKEIATLLDIDKKKVDNSLLKTRKKLEKHFLF